MRIPMRCAAVVGAQGVKRIARQMQLLLVPTKCICMYTRTHCGHMDFKLNEVNNIPEYGINSRIYLYFLVVVPFATILSLWDGEFSSSSFPSVTIQYLYRVVLANLACGRRNCVSFVTLTKPRWNRFEKFYDAVCSRCMYVCVCASCP